MSHNPNRVFVFEDGLRWCVSPRGEVVGAGGDKEGYLWCGAKVLDHDQLTVGAYVNIELHGRLRVMPCRVADIYSWAQWVAQAEAEHG